jgi:5-methylcytosine-specific restriction endonuclease McrA
LWRTGRRCKTFEAVHLDGWAALSCVCTLFRVYNSSMTRICARCPDTIPDTKRSDAKYCSEKCKKAVEYKNYYKPKIMSRFRDTCKLCRSPISEDKKADSIYCSKLCKRKVNRKNHNTNREGLKRSNAGYVPYDYTEWEKLKRRFNYCCAYCGLKKPLEQDHVVPLSRGGRHAIANILPCCRQCNMSKKDKFLSEWKFSSALRIVTPR